MPPSAVLFEEPAALVGPGTRPVRDHDEPIAVRAACHDRSGPVDCDNDDLVAPDRRRPSASDGESETRRGGVSTTVRGHPEAEQNASPVAMRVEKAFLPEHAAISPSIPKGATSLCRTFRFVGEVDAGLRTLSEEPRR